VTELEYIADTAVMASSGKPFRRMISRSPAWGTVLKADEKST
jgi:hypothetical protein